MRAASRRPARARRGGHRPGRIPAGRLGATRRPAARANDSLLDHRVRNRRPPTRSRPGTTLNYPRLRRARSQTPAPAVPPVQIADLAAGAQAAVIEILAALLERARTGGGRRIVISIDATARTASSSHRLGGEPIPRLLTGRRRLLPHLRDGRRPLPDGGSARAEVLAAASAISSSAPISPDARSQPSCPSSRSSSGAAPSPRGSSCSSTKTRVSARCSPSREAALDLG